LKLILVYSLKVFVRAFDSDERLVGVAFLDVGVYVTSLQTLKNLLLVGDAVKSIWFVAFQVRMPLPDFGWLLTIVDIGGALQAHGVVEGCS